MASIVSIRTTPEMLSQFSALAESTGRSRSFLINQAMKEFLEREEWQIKSIQQALKEADAGDFATEEEIAALDSKWGYHAN